MMSAMNAYNTMIKKIIVNAIYTIRRRGMECEPEQIEVMDYAMTSVGNGMRFAGFLKTKDAYMFRDALALELVIEYINYKKKHDDDRLEEPSVNFKKNGLEIVFRTNGY